MDVKVQNKSIGGQSRQSGASPESYRNSASKSGRSFVVGALILLVLVVGTFACFLLWNTKMSQSGANAVDANKFQAVFLTNGQVYFGKASSMGSSYVDLKNIYYLQVQQSVQPSTDSPESNTSGTDGDSKVSLTKLGKELHGPTDEMHISRDQILFWENLKDDSTVVKAIKDYETKK